MLHAFNLLCQRVEPTVLLQWLDTGPSGTIVAGIVKVESSEGQDLVFWDPVEKTRQRPKLVMQALVQVAFLCL